MPVIGLNFTRLEAKKGQDSLSGEIKVNSAPKITDVREITLTGLGNKALSMDFEFSTHYAPDVGEITLEGNVLFLTDKNPAILKQWNKDKTLPPEVSVPVLNHLFRRCLVKISVIADDLQLPPPLQIPRVRQEEEQKSLKGI